MDLQLRANQIEALDISKNNDYISGIHYHATGTGKSWIAMHLISDFNKKYPDKNILWICERKDILLQQFSPEIIRLRSFDKILQKFNMLEFVKKKENKWYDSLNCKNLLGKPFLCIINRSYLTSQKKYQEIKSPIHLVIHDECHTIENKTSQQFYKWLVESCKKHNILNRVIGFSATPERIDPLQNILSKFSIYDGFLSQVILPPRIIWIKSEKEIKFPHLMDILKTEISKLPYQKIIVWCGIIKECLNVASNWKSHFPDFTLCVDFNNIQKYQREEIELHDFDTFYNSLGKSILFCAVKHREGSDIPRIDGCIFMDRVEKRSERVFIQCMGRVLRKDVEQKKKYGLVIDLKAKSTIEVCNRVQYYLKLENIFPWKYKIQKIKLDNRSYFINELEMVSKTFSKETVDKLFLQTYTKEIIPSYFVRAVPSGIEYQERLEHELDLIDRKNLFGNMVRAIEILEMTKNIPHITRGSCGSSLVCYLLGISHVDPVKYEISFARFINEFRNTLPDIDFDFPHYLRDEVFLKLFQKWGNRVARISNHNYYHEKSALRESLRQNGIRKFISKHNLSNEIKSLEPKLQNKIYQTQRELEGTFRGFSLHCGGIIYYPEGIPEDNILGRPQSIIPQVKLNRDDVSQNKNFKIDILSSRALSQLYYCHSFQMIDFDRKLGDKKTIELLCQGKNIGITLAESPLMRKALLLVQPQSIMDLAICLSIIRPAAKDARKEFELGKYQKESIIFDDDVIFIVSKLLDCSEDMADKLRRGYCKNEPESLKILEDLSNKKSLQTKYKVKKILENLRKYGFCKAHALSYAQLVWQLAYQKAHRPKKFWRSTLKNIDTCYKPWVHYYEAKCEGISIPRIQKKKSIYAEQRNQKIKEELSYIEQLKKYGTWEMQDTSFMDRCYYFKSFDNYLFRGLIANSRTINYGKFKKLILLVGVEKQKYIEVVVTGNIKFDGRRIIIKGKGTQSNNLYGTIECFSNQVEFI